MEPHAFDNLGGIARTVDVRDLDLGAAIPSTYPEVFMQDSAFTSPIFYQGQRPACGAHAGIWLRSFFDSTKYTPRFTWIDIKKDGTSPSDGVTMTSIFKSLQSGADVYEPLENDVTLGDVPYASANALTNSMIQESKNHPSGAYAFTNRPYFEELKGLIFQHKAVILLIEVGKTMWTAPDGTGSWQEKDILPLRPPSTIVSGHFIVAHSYDKDYVYFANSWSTSWGRNGHGYFAADYMPFVLEAGSIDTTFHYTFNINLVYGAVGHEVNMLQLALAQLGYLPKGTQGPYGPQTKAAVAKLQKDHGIVDDGTHFGPQTRMLINKLLTN